MSRDVGFFFSRIVVFIGKKRAEELNVVLYLIFIISLRAKSSAATFFFWSNKAGGIITINR